MYIQWSLYLGEIVAGLRLEESAEEIACRLNRRYELTLTKNHIISAMKTMAQDRRMKQNGPILRLLRSTYPLEADELIRRYRAKRGGQPKATRAVPLPRAVPGWKRKLTPAQLEVFREIAAERAPVVVFRCPRLVLDPLISEEVPCGKRTRHPCCASHRVEARRWMVEELSNRVRRIA